MISMLCLVWLAFSALTAANTEIINIVANLHHGSGVVSAAAAQWPWLSSGTPEKSFKIVPAPLGSQLEDVCLDASPSCPHEMWVGLILNSSSWNEFSRFTLRLSWPASSPADFLITVHSPDETGTILRGEQQQQHAQSNNSASLKTRRQFAWIRAVNTGLRAHSLHYVSAQPVPFTLILEPLYFGVLPRSVIPILLFLVFVVTLAALVVAPFVNGYLARVAAEAKSDHPSYASKQK